MNIENILPTPIVDLGEYCNNHLWIKREDLIPFSFGGNKARKAIFFFDDIDKGDYDSVVTYGSGSSNHCRIIANECYRRGLECYIICPKESSKRTFNSYMVGLFDAKITVVPVSSVHNTIDDIINKLRDNGKKPYFIAGGGHGNIGTEAYVKCYKEIKIQEQELNVHFDYIFFASGTGTTQAGLVCGKLIHHDYTNIVGISIARKNPRGRNIVVESVRSYLNENYNEDDIQSSVVFLDDYTSGYGKSDIRVLAIVKKILKEYGIPLDVTYTGKAFWGMTEYIKSFDNKQILFLHTGGTPLFFDDIYTIR